MSDLCEDRTPALALVHPSRPWEPLEDSETSITQVWLIQAYFKTDRQHQQQSYFHMIHGISVMRQFRNVYRYVGIRGPLRANTDQLPRGTVGKNFQHRVEIIIRKGT